MEITYEEEEGGNLARFTLHAVGTGKGEGAGAESGVEKNFSWRLWQIVGWRE